MPKITACIVTHNNNPEHVKEAISSFHAQQGDFEKQLIVVDNGSTTDLLEQIGTFENTVIIPYGENIGFGAGQNIGLGQANDCDYFLVLNPDVKLHDSCLETLISFLSKHQNVGAVIPKVQFPDGTIQPLNKRNPTVFNLFARRFLPKSMQSRFQKKMDHYMMLDVGYDHSYPLEFMSGCFMLIRKSTLDEVDGFDERFFLYMEDADLTRRINQISQAYYCPDATITHHWARGSHKQLKLTWIMIQSTYRYFQKWGWQWR